MAVLYGDGAMQPALLANQLRPGPALPRQGGMVSPALIRAFSAALASAQANPPANPPQAYVDYRTVGPGPYAPVPGAPGIPRELPLFVHRQSPLVINSPGWYHPLLRGSAPAPVPLWQREFQQAVPYLEPAAAGVSAALQSPY